MPTAVVIGGTGLIGQEIVKSLLADGYEIKVLSRSKSKVNEVFTDKVIAIEWDGKSSEKLASIINGCELLINLAGHTIAVPWTKSNKHKIWSSRINTTGTIAEAINACNLPPKVFVQASAVGYYSHNTLEQLNETSPKGKGFLADLTAEWEKQAMICATKTRVVLIRTGIVLSSKGGFLPKILNPIKFFIGATLGSGKQIIPWIHITDHISAIKFLAQNTNAQGAFNLVAPQPVSLLKLTKAVGKKIRRPVLFKIPAFLLKLILGDMAREMLLANQTIEPKKLEEMCFKWKYTEMDDALNNLLIEH